MHLYRTTSTIKVYLLLFLASVAAFAQSGTCGGITLGTPTQGGGQLNGFIPFPLSAGWHKDISGDSVDPKSSTYIENLRRGADRRFRSIYSSGQTDAWGTLREGVPYHVVGAGQPRRPVLYSPDGYPSESDPGPFPIPATPLIQGTINAGGTVDYSIQGDRHVVVIDKDSCLLYELYSVDYTKGTIVAGTSAVFDLLGGDHQRPAMYTSTSVSGLPLFPGMIRGDELAAGVINHPISITAFYYPNGDWTPDKSYTGMASHHQYGNGGWDPAQMPIGSKMRLRPDFDVSSFPPQAQLILNTMKKYGAILIDGGGTIDTYSAMANEWDAPSTEALYTNFRVTSSDFEVIQNGTVYCDAMYACGAQPPAGPKPVISSFTASSATVSAGSPVTLSWNVSGVPTRIRFVTPDVGPVVTDSVVVNPTATTTYTLMVQNEYGRTSQTVTVNVSAAVATVTAPGLTLPANGATGVAASPALAWTAGANATSYDVYLGTTASPALIATVTTTTYQPGALTAGATYYWRVVAKNSASNATSDTFSFTVAKPPSPPPAGPALTSPANGATGVPLTSVFRWTAVPAATSYDMYLGVTASALSRIRSVNATSVSIRGLRSRTTYYWKVIAQTPSGSLSSSIASFLTN
jgi:hypothetical protein